MTRMTRIYADFYHAFGAIRINLATKAESHEETIFDPARFVPLLLRGKKLCRRQSKIRVNPRRPRRPRCFYCRFGMDKEE
jgi:hypothetical protein